MTQELIGLEYLQKKEIKNMTCDPEKPYAFISYSHDEYDAQIVMNVFKQLYTKGYNLWIDTANMPLSEEDWKMSAVTALMNKSCKFAFFFRSESSLTKATIAKELETIKKLKHIGPIVVIDIWHTKGNNAENHRTDLLNSGNINIYQVCDKICDIVSVEAKAIRLNSDMDNDISQLVEEMADVLTEKGVLTKKPNIIDPPDPESAHTISLKDFFKTYNNKTFNKSTFSQMRIIGNGEYAKYTTDFYDSSFPLVWDFIIHLLQEDPKRITTINQLNAKSVNPVFVSSETYQNLSKDDQTKYRQIDAEGLNDCYMYRRYSQYDWFKAALKARMNDLKFPLDAFVLEYKISDNDYETTTTTTTTTKPPVVDEGDLFEYELWGTLYTASTLKILMNDCFDRIAERYPDKIEAMADDMSISSVARKDDVDQKKLPQSKLDYFHQKQEHTIEEHTYYVSNRYGRPQGIEQVKRMLLLCEGNADAFLLKKEPKIKAKNTQQQTKKSNKKGVGELL